MSSYPPILGVDGYCCTRSHSDTPHSIRLLCTSVQPDGETSTWQYTIFTRDRKRQPSLRRDSNTQSHKASGCRTKP